MLICCGYVKVSRSLYIQVINCVNTIYNHIDTRTIMPRCEGSCMVYKPQIVLTTKIPPNFHNLHYKAKKKK